METFATSFASKALEICTHHWAKTGFAMSKLSCRLFEPEPEGFEPRCRRVRDVMPHNTDTPYSDSV